MAKMYHQLVEVQIGRDKEQAALLFRDQQVLALVVYLDPQVYLNDPAIAGKWSVEIGFGACAVGSQTVLFDDLEASLAWAQAELASKSTDRTE